MKSRPCLLSRSLCAALVGAVLAAGVLGAPAPGVAAGGGGGHGGGGGDSGGSHSDKITKRPRDEADKTGGTLIQLETMWMPVLARRGTRSYIGVTVHLIPNPDKLPEACYVTPWVTEALIIHFNAHPVANADPASLEAKALRDRLMAICTRLAGEGVFQEVRVINGPAAELDLSDAELSLVCV